MKLKPPIIYLTDGGGGQRLRETSEGLQAAGVGDVTFLNFPEQTFYDALLRQNVSFLTTVCERVQAVLPRNGFDSIFCDAVEWYNPVHDLSLPIVHALASELTLLYEVPLIHQARDGFVFQRAPVGRRQLEQRYDVPEEALGVKVTAWKETYKILYSQYGSMLGNVRDISKTETVMGAGDPARNVDEGVVLRYDERGQKLHGNKAITRDRHYLPLIDAFRKSRAG